MGLPLSTCIYYDVDTAIQLTESRYYMLQNVISVAFLKAAVLQIVHIIWNLTEQNYTMGWKMVNFTHLVKVSFKFLRFDLMLYVSNIGESLINSICW